MSIRQIVWISLFLFLSASPKVSADLRLLLVGDTFSPDLSASVATDLDNIRETMYIAAECCRFKVHETVLVGVDATPKKLIATIEKMRVNPDDVLMFYFSGHGYRTPSKQANPWPNLFFIYAVRGIDFDLVVSKLKEKQPRLLVAIADCCNDVHPDEIAPPIVKAFVSPAEASRTMKKNYRSLFRKSTGSIIATSSQPGEFSSCVKAGGIYTLALLRSLRMEVLQKRKPSWELVFDRAAQLTSDSDVLPHPQHPQFLVEIERNHSSK